MHIDIVILVRIAIWATFILQIFDGILLTVLVPRSLHFLGQRVKAIEDWMKAHDRPAD